MLRRVPWISLSVALLLLAGCRAALDAAQRDGIAGAGFALFAAAGLILAAIILAPKLVPVFSWPFTALIDRIYSSDGDHENVPPLTLRLARGYARDYRLEDALDEYEVQLERHPGEMQGWKEALEVARRTREPEVLLRWERLARDTISDRVEQARLGLG